MKPADFSTKLKNLCTKCASLCKTEIGIRILDFLFLVIVYGFAINFMAVTFLKFPALNFLSAVAFGLLFYFIREEVPMIIRRIIK